MSKRLGFFLPYQLTVCILQASCTGDALHTRSGVRSVYTCLVRPPFAVFLVKMVPVSLRNAIGLLVEPGCGFGRTFVGSAFGVRIAILAPRVQHVASVEWEDGERGSDRRGCLKRVLLTQTHGDAEELQDQVCSGLLSVSLRLCAFASKLSAFQAVS
jgi:hypothetical protein